MLRDQAGNVMAALEVKRFAGPQSYLNPSIFTNKLVDFLSRAEGDEDLVDLAASIASEPDNAKALAKASSSLHSAHSASAPH